MSRFFSVFEGSCEYLSPLQSHDRVDTREASPENHDAQIGAKPENFLSVKVFGIEIVRMQL